ncbi:unnamed protein product [Gadus morhua 'NCC']
MVSSLTELPHIWSPFKSPEGEVYLTEPKGNGSHEKSSYALIGHQVADLILVSSLLRCRPLVRPLRRDEVRSIRNQSVIKLLGRLHHEDAVDTIDLEEELTFHGRGAGWSNHEPPSDLHRRTPQPSSTAETVSSRTSTRPTAWTSETSPHFF